MWGFFFLCISFVTPEIYPFFFLFMCRNKRTQVENRLTQQLVPLMQATLVVQTTMACRLCIIRSVMYSSYHESVAKTHLLRTGWINKKHKKHLSSVFRLLSTGNNSKQHHTCVCESVFVGTFSYCNFILLEGDISTSVPNIARFLFLWSVLTHFSIIVTFL